MNDRVAFLERAYRLFNDRHVDALFEMMSPDVEWPDVANAAVLRGASQIRSYWEAQFAVANPRVEPTEFFSVGDDVVAVVDQRVLGLDGSLLAGPATVFHRYSFADDLVRRMVVFADHASASR